MEKRPPGWKVKCLLPGRGTICRQIRVLLQEERAPLKAENPDLQQLEGIDQTSGFRALRQADQHPAVGARADWSQVEFLRELAAMRRENVEVLQERTLRVGRQFMRLRKGKTAILKYIAHEKERL